LCEIYGEKFRFKILDQKPKIYRIEILSAQNKKIFIDSVQKITGAELIDDTRLECIDYQIKLIKNYLETTSNNNFDLIDTVLTEIKENKSNINDLNNRISNINMLISNEATKSRKQDKTFTFHYEYHYKFNPEFEIVLVEKNLLDSTSDCILNTFDQNKPVPDLTNNIFSIAGKKFQNDFYKNINNLSKVT
jgi:hypothetical protein